ncbi:hypothetical protein [Pedobacter sp. SYSU D00535]|uniref:hypothetical protein n=1 Tax=Pedobacter sp. SYSU D00535 TaxID=2810308 RepID=UPI001A97A672|nr:hypothetical protein [Pedobacter sp. SYSU D00535]
MDIIAIAAPAILTLLGNFLFYTWVKKRVDSNIEKFKITYSGVFKEKIDVYKSLLGQLHDLKLKVNQYQYHPEQSFQRAIMEDFNAVVRSYSVNKPFFSDAIHSLFKEFTVELRSVFEAFATAERAPRSVEADKGYWDAVNKLRKGEIFVAIEDKLVAEIRADLQIPL